MQCPGRIRRAHFDLKIVIIGASVCPCDARRHSLSTLTRARTLSATPADSGDVAGQRTSAAMVRTRPRIVCGGLEGLKNAAKESSARRKPI